MARRSLSVRGNATAGRILQFGTEPGGHHDYSNGYTLGQRIFNPPRDSTTLRNYKFSNFLAFPESTICFSCGEICAFLTICRFRLGAESDPASKRSAPKRFTKVSMVRSALYTHAPVSHRMFFVFVISARPARGLHPS